MKERAGHLPKEISVMEGLALLPWRKVHTSPWLLGTPREWEKSGNMVRVAEAYLSVVS